MADIVRKHFGFPSEEQSFDNAQSQLGNIGKDGKSILLVNINTGEPIGLVVWDSQLGKAVLACANLVNLTSSGIGIAGAPAGPLAEHDLPGHNLVPGDVGTWWDSSAQAEILRPVTVISVDGDDVTFDAPVTVDAGDFFLAHRGLEIGELKDGGNWRPSPGAIAWVVAPGGANGLGGFRVQDGFVELDIALDSESRSYPKHVFLESEWQTFMPTSAGLASHVGPGFFNDSSPVKRWSAGARNFGSDAAPNWARFQELHGTSVVMGDVTGTPGNPWSQNRITIKLANTQFEGIAAVDGSKTFVGHDDGTNPAVSDGSPLQEDAAGWDTYGLDSILTGTDGNLAGLLLGAEEKVTGELYAVYQNYCTNLKLRGDQFLINNFAIDLVNNSGELLRSG